MQASSQSKNKKQKKTSTSSTISIATPISSTPSLLPPLLLLLSDYNRRASKSASEMQAALAASRGISHLEGEGGCYLSDMWVQQNGS